MEKGLLALQVTILVLFTDYVQMAHFAFFDLLFYGLVCSGVHLWDTVHTH